MRYESPKSERGNTGVSYESQQAADDQARQMDANGCSDCSECSGCSRCSGCSGCSGCIRWRGGKAEQLLSVNGLRWPVAISIDKMQIGCENHTHAEWQGCTDAQIQSMDRNALDFWGKHKDLLLHLCTLRAGATKCL